MEEINDTMLQSSDSLPVGMLLAFAGGFLDVTTYLTRGRVFTYAVTGNLIFLAMDISGANFHDALKYIFPIIAFATGIFLTAQFRHRSSFKRFHWRQGIILAEILLIILSACIPQGNLNIISNVLLAFISSMQTEAFRKFHGNPYASTMCTGNLRSSFYWLQRYTITKDRNLLNKATGYIKIILMFFIGAVLGGFLVKATAEKTVLFAVIPLLTVFLLMNSQYYSYPLKKN